MKKNRKNLALTCAIALIAAVSIPMVNAELIYAESAVSTGGEYDKLFKLDNLSDEGLTTTADTISAAIGFKEALGYATTRRNNGGYPVIITFDFTSATDIDAFHLWNYVVDGGHSKKGIKDFTLTFYDGAEATGRTVGDVFSGAAKEAPTTGSFASEVFTVGKRSGVKSIKLTIANNLEKSTVFVGAREIAFNAVSERASPSLLSIGGITITLSSDK